MSVSLVKMAVLRPVPTQWDPLNVGAILDTSWPMIILLAMVWFLYFYKMIQYSSIALKDCIAMDLNYSKSVTSRRPVKNINNYTGNNSIKFWTPQLILFLSYHSISHISIFFHFPQDIEKSIRLDCFSYLISSRKYMFLASNIC